MDSTTGSIARMLMPNATKSKPTAVHVKSSTTTSHGASAAGPKLPSTTGMKHHAANVSPSAAHPKPDSTVKPPQAGVAGSRPNAISIQTVSEQLGKRGLPRLNEGPDIVHLTDIVHQKAIQSIDDADKAMSMGRADLKRTKASKEYQNTVVFMANEVAAALLAPSRQVVHLLAGHGVLFPPCKQVSKSLSVRISGF
jgi:hypothetical protein